ncbi:MAG: hypothetical protein A2Y62_20475 [Candidatus Fischerbacteria bacterium RBG_13_37_8]|uniref:Uncharacterized protein n=1 Tax=Candidatus Fischerbacteria bacterium RBG_13_37_8 TaxID=1817863 RepID=A0A1F5VX91_9BACT|nr:MAG: hypothetical protein A2Y62_20475 [Candidatus Fischerbacteria bacterium RBG_13_37_8]
MSAISEKKHSIVAFFVLAYLITWAFWIPFVVFAPSATAIGSNSELRSSPLMLLQVFGNFGPTFAAFVQPVKGGTWVPYVVNILSACVVAVLVVTLNRTRMCSRQSASS